MHIICLTSYVSELMRSAHNIYANTIRLNVWQHIIGLKQNNNNKRERERQTNRQTETERQRQRNRETERDRDRERR